MTISTIPLTNDPNQKMALTLPGDSGNIPVNITVNWNRIANYWTLSVYDQNLNALVLGLPLLVSDGVYGDLMAQYKYLNLGTWFVYPISKNLNRDPVLGDWGTNFSLVWGD